MNKYDLINLKRKFVRRLNYHNLFFEIKPDILLIIAGYTRSGTTFYGNILSSILKARNIHEPLNPNKVKDVSFFNERESSKTIRNSQIHKKALRKIFSQDFKGNRYTNRGSSSFYRHRIIKIVRGNFYLDLLSEMLPETRFSIIVRHPCACVSSRIRLGWCVPDHSHCIDDILPILNKRQKKVIETVCTVHEKMAASWCLDNIMLLRHINNSKFYFIFYEDLVSDILYQIKKVLHFMENNVSERIIKKEINLYQHLSLMEPQKLSFGWKKDLKENIISDILNIVKIFELDHLYNMCSHEPNHF